MLTHQSNINFKNLIRQLATMYSFDVAEVVIVELVANSLDAKATQISINFNPSTKLLIVEDNGKGMSENQFEEYHDFAAGLKTKGEGIGFAGLGAKISFDIADRVLTKTKSDSFAGGSDWHFQSHKSLVWEDINPSHIKGHGTRVEVHFKSASKIPYSSREDLLKLLRYHYLPLFDSNFLDLYNKLGFYSNKLRFFINGEAIMPTHVKTDFNLDKVKEFRPTKANKKFGYGIFGIADTEYPLAPDLCGVLLCTYGKVIKSEFFNQFPGNLGSRIFGLVEIPDFVKFLTTAKTGFTHTTKHREFEKLYDPIRQEFKIWLKNLGLETMEVEDIDEAKKLERELKKLIDDVPELADFFGFRSRKSILGKNEKGTVQTKIEEGVAPTFPFGEGIGGVEPGPIDIGDEPGQTLVKSETGTQKAEPISRTSHQGPKISFTDRPDREDMAWVDGNKVVLNRSHPSHIKVCSNPIARRLHHFFAIANAIQKFKGSESETLDLMFIDKMMTAWGKK